MKLFLVVAAGIMLGVFGYGLHKADNNDRSELLRLRNETVALKQQLQEAQAQIIDFQSEMFEAFKRCEKQDFAPRYPEAIDDEFLK